MEIYTPESWITLRTMAFNGIWIIGAAIDLAVISFILYELRLKRATLTTLINKPEYTQWLLMGTLLITIGAALTTWSLWRIILYSGCSLLLLARRIAENRIPRIDHDNKN